MDRGWIRKRKKKTVLDDVSSVKFTFMTFHNTHCKQTAAVGLYCTMGPQSAG